MKEGIARNIKGAGDRLPAQQIIQNGIIDILKRNFESYGYAPMETAVLNYLDLMTYKYENDAEIVREIYKLKDQGERDLGLRFDLTVPFCKVAAMNRNLRLPFKRYEIGKVFRNGPVKAGRVREFYQCDVDCVGAGGVHIEAELISLAVKCFVQFGIEPVIKYGNRKLLTQLIEDAGIAPEKGDAAVGIVDKMAKVSRDELLSELCKITSAVSAGNLLDSFINCPKNEDILQLEKALYELDVLKYCEFAPYLARGLNIYTGTVWEVFDKQQRIASSLGGGGRYDKIITNFIDDGRNYPAAGMSFGLEPITAVLTQNGVRQTLVDILVIPIGTENACQKFADKLRSSGKRVLVYLGGGKVSKAFEYANAEGIPFAAVVGENEITSGTVLMKDMQTGKSEAVKL